MILITVAALSPGLVLGEVAPGTIETAERDGIAWLKQADKLVSGADFVTALDLYEKARRTFEQGGIEDRQGQALLGAGFAYYNLGDLEKAETAARDAIRKVAVSPEKLWSVASNAHRILGNVHTDRGAPDQALDEFLVAAEMAQAHGSRGLTAQIECEIGMVYWNLGEYRRAIEYLERALEVGRDLRRDELQLDARIALGNLYLELNDYRTARDHLEHALDLAQKDDDPFSIAVVFDGLAYLYNSLGDPERSMAIRIESLRHAKRVSSEKLLGGVYASMGHEYLLHKEYAKADEYLTQAEKYSVSCRDEWNLIWINQDLSAVRAWQGRHGDAIAAATSAVEIARRRNEIEELWSSLYLQGVALREAGRGAEALVRFQEALETIDSGRAGMQQGLQRSGYMTNKQALYEATVAELIASERSADALVVSERFRARTFLETLQQPSLHGRIVSGDDPRMEDFYSPDFAGVGDVRESLLEDDGDVFVEYFMGEKRLYGFAVSRNEYVVRDLGASTDVIRMVTRYLGFLSREEETFSGGDGARRLYGLLLEPLLSRLTPFPARIVISPDSVLHLLPFETLVTPDDGFLLERCTISYTPSATIQRKLKERAAVSAQSVRLVAVADPAAQTGADERGAALPYSVREIREISRQFGDSRVLLTGSAATKKNFFALDLSRPSVFHFASHAVISESDALASHISFHDQGDDSDLTFNDIMGKKWTSPMAVLSACSSGRGRLLSGEGVDGFARGFFYSGVNALVYTLWNVEDHVSYLLMKDFYKELASGAKIGEALRAAKLKRIGEHPSHWAGFVASGLSDRPVFAERADPPGRFWGWAFALILSAAVALWLLLHHRRPVSGHMF